MFTCAKGNLHNFRQTTLKLHQKLQILREREARYAGNAPLDLLNQIEDYQQAIALIEQANASQLTEARWKTPMDEKLKILTAADIARIGTHLDEALEHQPGSSSGQHWLLMSLLAEYGFPTHGADEAMELAEQLVSRWYALARH
ncbi:MAG: hypothetical protein AB1801_27860 [Chloroflexota bacterium]